MEINRLSINRVINKTYASVKLRLNLSKPLTKTCPSCISTFSGINISFSKILIIGVVNFFSLLIAFKIGYYMISFFSTAAKTNIENESFHFFED